MDDSDLPDFSKSFKENADLFLSVALMFKKISMSSDQWRRRQWHPTPVLLPGKSHEQRSLVGCSPWGGKEWDMTERLLFHALEKEMASHSCVLAWRIPGTGEPGGLPSMGLQSDTTEATQQQQQQ